MARAGNAAAAVSLHALDAELGARRRALLADLVRAGTAGERSSAHARRSSQRAAQRAGAPRSDAELRARVQGALDRLVSYPRALHVSVEDGVVRLAGWLLAQEREGVLAQVERLPGVISLIDVTTSYRGPAP